MSSAGKFNTVANRSLTDRHKKRGRHRERRDYEKGRERGRSERKKAKRNNSWEMI